MKVQDGLLYERVVEDIRQSVSIGKLKPGDRLPSILEMCRVYDVSAITARRAVQELKAAGLVSTFNGRGIFVKGTPNVELRAREAQGAAESISRLVVMWGGAEFADSPDYFMYDVWKGISHAAHERGLSVSTEIIPVTLTSIPHVPFTPERGQGIIVLGPMVSPFVLSILVSSSVPSVLVDAGCMGTCCVVTDNFSGMRQSLLHLKGLGHRVVGFSGNFSAGWNSTNENERYEAFMRLTREFGMQGEPFRGRKWDSLFDRLTQPNPPTAMLLSRDECALEVLNMARHRGIRVPQEFSVVGFDGFSRESEEGGLTTVRVDRNQLGRTAVQRVLSFADQPENRCLWTRVEPQLVIRGTTGPTWPR